MTKEFDYITWRNAYVAEHGAAADAVDYYCTILVRAPGQGAEHANLERFLTSKGINYAPGKREFKPIEALWGHLRDDHPAAVAEEAAIAPSSMSASLSDKGPSKKKQ